VVVVGGGVVHRSLAEDLIDKPQRKGRKIAVERRFGNPLDVGSLMASLQILPWK